MSIKKAGPSEVVGPFCYLKELFFFKNEWQNPALFNFVGDIAQKMGE